MAVEDALSSNGNEKVRRNRLYGFYSVLHESF
jgi:hypothetical protein